MVEFQKGYTEQKTIYLIGIEVPDSWKDSIFLTFKYIKMELTMINLGRNNINKTVTIKNEKAMWKEISKYLMSKDIELSETDEPNKCDVYVGGFRKVGQVIIKE